MKPSVKDPRVGSSISLPVIAAAALALVLIVTGMLVYRSMSEEPSLASIPSSSATWVASRPRR